MPAMIYLDHNATTPVLPRPPRGFFILHSSFILHPSEEWGNPSSAYKFGSKLKGVIETAGRVVPALAGATVVADGDALLG